MIQKNHGHFFFAAFWIKKFCDSDAAQNFVSKQSQFSVTKLKIEDSDSHNLSSPFSLLAEFPQL